MPTPNPNVNANWNEREPPLLAKTTMKTIRPTPPPAPKQVMRSARSTREKYLTA
jgi:hypothetical protein